MTRSDYLELIMDHAINQGLSSPDFIRKVYAMDNAELAIMLDNRNSDAYYYRALTYLNRHETDIAVKDLKKAAKLGSEEAVQKLKELHRLN